MKTIYIMIGIPGSGKSTWVKDETKNMKDYIVLNADSIRKELYGDESIQGNGKTVFQILHERLRRALLNNKLNNIFIDNTSTTEKSRKTILNIIEENCKDCKIIFKVFDNFEEARKRNKKRDRIVPDEVLDRMQKQFEKPKKSETSLSSEIQTI